MRTAIFLIAGLASAVSLPAAAADTAVTTIGDLPLSVKAEYEKLCQPDYWISNRRVLDGSTSDKFADGTSVFLMVCGDAASTTPYTVIVMAPDGEARQPKFNWVLRGKDVGESEVGNAHFGRQPGTIVSSGHVSAECNPTYTHVWDGTAFQLIALNRKGCRKGE